MKRKTGIELMRIVAMFLIVMHHYAQVGLEPLLETTLVSGERFFAQALFLGGKLGVNLFVLTTGYFLCMQERKWSKVVSLVVQILTYSIISMIILAVVYDYSFSVMTIIMNCFPLTFERYGFPTTYVILYILSPYINTFIGAMSRKMHKQFLITGAVLWIVLPTVTSQMVGLSDLVWFVYLYVLAAYLRKYPIEREGWNRGGRWLLLGSAMYLLTYLSVVVFDIVGMWIPAVGMKATYFVSGYKIPMVLTAILLFSGFVRLEIKYNKVICKIASCTFGVFLFHIIPSDMSFLWNKILKVPEYLGTNQIYIHALASVLVIFVAGVIVELIRQAVMNMIHKGILSVSVKKQ